MPGHYCTIHQKPFFKTERMKGYAHPVVDEEGNPQFGEDGKQVWCNEEIKDSTSKPTPKPTDEMTKEDWADKDRVTRKSIERQKALELAIEFAKRTEAEVKSGQIIATAKVFEQYLETGN